MSLPAGAPQVRSVAELYAVAYQIEADAEERYALLAAQMEVHHNAELARIFRELERVEGLHAREIARRAASADIAAQGRRLGRWRWGESPEALELDAPGYLMSAHEAVSLALAAEQRAVEFYTGVHASLADRQAQSLAREFIDEERRHVELCQSLLARYPAPAPGAREDPDPPSPQD